MCRTIDYSELKYMIKYYFKRISKHYYSIVISEFPRIFKIEPKTFQCYFLTRKDYYYLVPSFHLIKLAKFFQTILWEDRILGSSQLCR